MSQNFLRDGVRGIQSKICFEFGIVHRVLNLPLTHKNFWSIYLLKILNNEQWHRTIDKGLRELKIRDLSQKFSSFHQQIE